MAKAASKKKLDFWHSRAGYGIEVIALIILSYAWASRAIDTGSLIEYAFTFIFLGFAINRIIKIFRS